MTLLNGPETIMMPLPRPMFVFRMTLVVIVFDDEAFANSTAGEIVPCALMTLPEIVLWLAVL